MALERDKQADIAALWLWYYQITQGGLIQYPVVDTQGFRTITFLLGPEELIDPNDEIEIQIWDSPDGVTWTRVPDYKLLPSEDTPKLVYQPIAPYAQSVGVVSSDRYVRLDIYGNVVRNPMLIDAFAILEAESKAFRDFDPLSLVLDGKP